MSPTLLGAVLVGVGLYLALTALRWGAPCPSLEEQLRRFDLDVQLAERTPRSGARPLLPWPGLDAALRPLLEDLARPARRLLGGADGLGSGLVADLTVLRPGATPLGFLAGQLLWAVVVGGAALAIVVGSGRLSAAGLAATGLLGVLGFLWPLLRLRAQARARRRRILAELPQIAQLLSSTVSAGLVPDAALERVARRSAGVLGLGLRRVSQQVSEGHQSLVDALAELGARERVPELGRLVALLRAADEQGLPVVQALMVMATSLLEQQAMRLVEAGEKGTVRMVLPLGMVMVPVMLLVVAVPTWGALRGLLGF